MGVSQKFNPSRNAAACERRDATRRNVMPGATASAQLGCDAQLIKCSLELLAHNAGRTASAGQDNAFRVGSRVSLVYIHIRRHNCGDVISDRCASSSATVISR